MKIIFGTDGWRGILGSEMNDENIALVAQAFADYLKENFKGKNIKAAIGFDGRISSDEFARSFAEILSGNGIEAFLSDAVVPTPVLSYYVKAMELDAGVMITASHNPAKYNGVKFKANYGGPFLTEETLKVEELLEEAPIQRSEDHIRITNLLPVYIEQIEKYINFEVIKNSGIKVLIDSMSGAGQKILQSLLEKHGCAASTIFGEAEEDFSGRSAEPIEKNLQHLGRELAANPVYALGIATDGDADRLGVMLDGGKWLSAQETILLLTDFIINGKKQDGHIVKTSSVTDKLRSNFETADRKVFDVQVGFKYICEKMIAEEVAIGCEESGGYGYKGHIPERDGILSGLLLTEMLASSGFKSLSAYAENKRKEFGNIHYDRIDYMYEKEDRIDKLPALYNNPPSKVCSFKIKDMDKYFSSRGIINGLKLYLEGDSRWLLLRASETEPMVRIYAEGQSDEEVKKILKQGVKYITG